VSIDSDGISARAIGSIVSFHFGPKETELILKKMSSPDIKLISLTITQNGYYQDSATGDLDKENEAIKWDLANLHKPQTAIGYIVAALANRRENNLPAFTLLSCDNLPGNGNILRKMVLQFAVIIDPCLAEWIEQNVCTPNSMVDRITPSMCPHYQTMIEAQFKFCDDMVVVAEPFSQFVIEDKFTESRPPFESAGVQIVQDALPYYMMKFILLNASHTVIATIAARRGIQYIHEAMSDPDIRKFVQDVISYEFTPLLPKVDVDLERYQCDLLRRFSNPELRDTVERVGAEGTRKIPKYVLFSIRKAIAKGSCFSRLSVVVAAWMLLLNKKNDFGETMELNDPKACQMCGMQDKIDAVMNVKDQSQACAMMKETMLAYPSVFGDLPECSKFISSVIEAIKNIRAQGTIKTIRSL
jgi:mannitol 2-dehydrogenase